MKTKVKEIIVKDKIEKVNVNTKEICLL